MGPFLLTLAFALSIVNFAVFLLLFRKQQNNYMFFTFVAIVVTCFGHLLLGFSESVDGAILANKINYLGSAFLPMLMFFTLAEVCRLRIHPVVRGLLIAFSCFVLYGRLQPDILQDGRVRGAERGGQLRGNIRLGA